jgi:hypothetical protein
MGKMSNPVLKCVSTGTGTGGTGTGGRGGWLSERC